MEVFKEVLEPLVKVATLKLDAEPVHIFNINFLVKKVLEGCLTLSKLSTCINIMYSFSSFWFMPHIFFSLYL